MADLVSLYKPRRHFLPFHARSQRWGVLVCHRRAGKTVAAVNELIERATYTQRPDARYSYVAPFFSQAKKVAWDYLLRYSQPFRKKANIAELTVELFNNSRISLYGGDNPDAMRGLYHDGVVLDEPAQMKPRLWPEVIRPALSDRKGWAVFTGTPRGKNDFWDIWDKAGSDPDWFRLMLKASETGILPDHELANARATMDEDEYEQEYECSFDAAIRGSFYGKQMVAALLEGRIGTYPYTEGFNVHTCWDLGYTDDTVIWFFQVINKRPVFFDCFAESGLAMSDYFDVLAEKRKKYGFRFGEYYLPHDARAHSLQTGRSIQDDFVARQIPARILPELSIQDGIQATRKMLGFACFDATACATGLEALRQYQREYNEDKKAFSQRPRHDWTSHYADSIRIGAIGYNEDYEAPKVFTFPQPRIMPPISDGVTLDRLWDTIPLHNSFARRI